jgi:tetratricopeptide (TPR) repeat protein
MKTKVLFTGICWMFLLPLTAQTAQQNIAAGNEKYRQQDYTGAQSHYEQATSTVEGTYNLGNALYNQQKYEQAAEKFSQAAQMATDSKTRGGAYHNLGNAMLQQKKYQESIDAYKKALRDNPENADTKYNLSYAQQMLKKQQQEQQQQQDKKKKDEQKQDQQKKQQQDPQQPDNNKQNEPNPKDMSKDELDRVLKSLNEDDKAVQDKINKQKSKPVSGDPEKDW